MDRNTGEDVVLAAISQPASIHQRHKTTLNYKFLD